jgi:hypothetical protein
MATGDIATLKAFFGLKAGQALADFAAELRDLTEEDREELVRLIRELDKEAIAA